MTDAVTHAPAASRASHRKDYFRIFVALFVLTVLEIGVAYSPIPRKIMVVLMVSLALTKAALVGLFYMHLRYEKRSLLWLAACPLPLAGLYAVFLMLDASTVLRALTIPWLRLHP